MSRRVPATALALLLLTAAASTGCSQASSSEEADLSNSSPDGLAVVSDRAIDALQPSDPARTVLEWYRALQFKDVRGALPFYVGSNRPTRETLSFQLATLGSVGGNPTITAVDESGDQATAFIEIPRGGVQPTLGSINLEKRGIGWQVSNNDLIQQLVLATDIQREREAKAARSAKGTGGG